VILRGDVGKSVAAAAIGLLAIAAPAPAAARVIVSVEVALGSVAVGGLGIFVAASGSSGSLAARSDIPDALVEFRGTRARLGMPLAPPETLPAGEHRGQPAANGMLLNLVRWRF
jgi:hypothetical protein